MVDCCIQVTVEPVLLLITQMLDVNSLTMYKLQLQIANEMHKNTSLPS